MPANLTFDTLKAAVASGEIDTVAVCLVDMQGRLMGKRFVAQHFIDGAHDETVHGNMSSIADDAGRAGADHAARTGGAREPCAVTALKGGSRSSENLLTGCAGRSI